MKDDTRKPKGKPPGWGVLLMSVLFLLLLALIYA
jgi:hypothetical protein